MKGLLILFLFLPFVASAQDLHEPALLVIDSSLDKIAEMNGLLFHDYEIEDAQVKTKQLSYIFTVHGHPLIAYYNIARNTELSDPTTPPPRYVDEIEIVGQGEDLLRIYNAYFSTATSLQKEKEHPASRPFVYHSTTYNASLAPVPNKQATWKLTISPY